MSESPEILAVRLDERVKSLLAQMEKQNDNQATMRICMGSVDQAASG